MIGPNWKTSLNGRRKFLPYGVRRKEGGHRFASLKDSHDVRLLRAHKVVSGVGTHLERVGVKLGDGVRFQESIWKWPRSIGLLQAVWPVKSRQMSFHLYQNCLKCGLIIVATAFKKWPKVQKSPQCGPTEFVNAPYPALGACSVALLS